MTYKKTWLSYLLWAVYTCLTGVMLANYAILFWQKKINDVLNYGTAIFVFFVFAGAAGVYFLIRSIVGGVRGKYRISSHTKFLWETFIVLSLFFAGLLYRVSFYLQNSSRITETSYYQLATVKAGEISEPMVHGASYLYTMCLSFVLSFLGNKIVVAVWLQILIQMVTILLTFLAVRRLAGSIPACIAMLVVAFSSVYTEQILTMTPESLFFALYLMGMFFIGGYVKNNCMGCHGKSSAIFGALLSGLVIGFLTYLDAVSLTLAVFLPGLVTGRHTANPERKCRDRTSGRGNTGFSVTLILTAIAAGAFAFTGMLILNAYRYNTEIETMAETLFTFYRTHFRTDYVLYRTEYSIVECFIIVALAAFLILAFWNRRKIQNASPWMCLMLLLAPTPLTARGVLPYQVYSVFVWGVLAGIGIQQSFVWESRTRAKARCVEDETAFMEELPKETGEIPIEVPSKETGTVSVEASSKETGTVSVEVPSKETGAVSVEVPSKETGAVSVEAPSKETDAVPVETPAKKPRFLENPLPLPKKHEKRTMDYQYEVVEERMKFDFEIDENDDFDIE